MIEATTHIPRTANKDDLYIAKQLQELRKMFGYTQYKVAKFLNVSEPQYCKYELGENRISAGNYAYLKRELYKIKDDNSEALIIELKEAQDKLKKIAKLIEQINFLNNE